MGDGRHLVFTFVQGTDGDAQWLSNFDFSPFGGNHHGLYTAAEKISKELVLFADGCGADPNNTFFAFDGYSRGAGIDDALASQSTLPGTGVALNETNCLAYTFEPPNTVSTQPDQKVSYVVDVVNGSDVVPMLPTGWHKNGVVMGYDYSPETIAEFYGLSEVDDSSLDGPHRADNVIATVFSGQPKEEYDKAQFTHTSVHCPTDVKVFHYDEVVASVVDNVATSIGDALIFTNDDGEKDVLTPYGEDYHIIIEATGNGTMEVAVDHQFGGGDVKGTEANQLKSYDIKKGDVYEVDFSTGQPISVDSDSINSGNDSSAEQSFFKLTKDRIIVAVVVALVGSIVLIKLSSGRKRRNNKTSNFR
jgi:hypothetical protein